MTFRSWLVAALRAVAFLAVSSALPASAQSTPPTDAFFGVAGHFLHVKRMFPDKPDYWRVDKTLPVQKELGARTVADAVYAFSAPGRALVSNGRQDPAWLAQVANNRKQVEEWLSQYDKSGTRLVLTILANPPSHLYEENNAEFVRWVGDLVVAHPSIGAVQMHNEPNLRSFWRGTPEDYVRIYKPFADEVHRRNPRVKVLVGAISSLWWPQGVAWLKKAVDAGVLDYADGISVHPYNRTNAPETDPFWRGANTSDPENMQKALLAFWKQVEAWNTGKKPLELYFTEFGYSTGRGIAEVADEAMQADYLSRSVLIYMGARLSGVPIHSIYWYDLKDDGEKDDNLQHRFGIVSFDLSRRKPAFDAYKAIIAAFGKVDDFAEAADKAHSSEPSLMVKTWRRKSDGATFIPFWSLLPLQTDTIARITLPPTKATSAMLHRADGSAATHVAIQTANGQPYVEVKPSTRAAWLEMAKP